MKFLALILHLGLLGGVSVCEGYEPGVWSPWAGERGGRRGGGPALSLRYSGANFHMSPACGASNPPGVRRACLCKRECAEPSRRSTSILDLLQRNTHTHTLQCAHTHTRTLQVRLSWLVINSQHASGEEAAAALGFPQSSAEVTVVEIY